MALPKPQFCVFIMDARTQVSTQFIVSEHSKLAKLALKYSPKSNIAVDSLVILTRDNKAFPFSSAAIAKDAICPSKGGAFAVSVGDLVGYPCVRNGYTGNSGYGTIVEALSSSRVVVKFDSDRNGQAGGSRQEAAAVESVEVELPLTELSIGTASVVYDLGKAAKEQAAKEAVKQAAKQAAKEAAIEVAIAAAIEAAIEARPATRATRATRAKGAMLAPRAPRAKGAKGAKRATK